MNVSGIRPYAGFYQYNSIKINQLRVQQVEAAQAQEPLQELVEPAEEFADVSVEQNFSSYDFAQQYRPDEEFELKGVDSDLASLDAERAVSDLAKDQVLQQYQYFVGDDAYLSVKPKQPDEVIFRSGENFLL